MPKKYTVTHTRINERGKKVVTKVQTEDEELVRSMLGKPKKDYMDADFKEAKDSGTNKKSSKAATKPTRKTAPKALPSPKLAKPLAKQSQRKEVKPITKKEASNSKGIYTTSELRKKLRSMIPYKEELVLGNSIIVKTHNGYGIRNINDHDDPMIDYSAYVYGFKEKWILERARKNGLLKD